MSSEMAVLTDTKEFKIFELTGADVFCVDRSNAKSTFLNVVKTHKLIFLTETLGKILEEEIESFESKPYPMILCLPTSKGESGFSYKNLTKKARNSLGLEI